jgi:hypothetical protein
VITEKPKRKTYCVVLCTARFACGGSPQSHRATEKTKDQQDPRTGPIIGAAIEVHRVLGPGLLESAYEECLCRELYLHGRSFEHQVELAYHSKVLLSIVDIRWTW